MVSPRRLHLHQHIIKNFTPATVILLCISKCFKTVLSRVYFTFDRLWFHYLGLNLRSKHERLTKLQKRAARIILCADFDTSSVSMFQELGWQSVGNRLKYNKAVLTYKALNNLAPEYIANLLKPMSAMHLLNLRSMENGILHVPRSRTTLYNGAFSCSAPRLWNSLPQEARSSESLNSFKKCLKSCL